MISDQSFNIGPEAQILVVNLSPISFNFDTLLHKWLKFDPGSHQINGSQVIPRKKPLMSRTSSTAKRAKSYARGKMFGQQFDCITLSQKLHFIKCSFFQIFFLKN